MTCSHRPAKTSLRGKPYTVCRISSKLHQNALFCSNSRTLMEIYSVYYDTLTNGIIPSQCWLYLKKLAFSIMQHTSLKWVLLVDDDETTNMLNRLFIKKVVPDIRIDAVTNGHRALDFLDAHIDRIEPGTFLLVLDIEMPLMNGWAFLEAYEILFKKVDRSKISISVLTANPSEELRNRALSNTNIQDCLHKPLSDINFRKIVKAYFSG